jgi:hypothetical protein
MLRLRRAPASLALAGSLACVITACAEGGAVEDGSGGYGGSSSDDTTSSGATSSTTQSSTTASTTSGGSGGAGGGDTTTSTSTGQLCDFTSLDTCPTADPMSPLAADKSQTPVTATGTGEAWFKIHMEEQDSGIFGADLSYRVTLTSPAGMDYDLDVQEGPQAGSPDCNAAIKNGAGTPEIVTASWGDDQGFGGEDDSLWLVIHVVYVGGDLCGPGDTWTLKVEGNI